MGQSPVLVFWLHNFAYGNRTAFEAVDYVIVPSEFSRRYYREKLGLECHVLPNIVHWEEAEVKGRAGPHPSPLPEGEGTRRYVTFINPQEIKGVYVFARIARELARRRPDIPILVTQGRSRGDARRIRRWGWRSISSGSCIRRRDARAMRWSQPAKAGTPARAAEDGNPAQPAEAGTQARNITTMSFTPDPRDFYPALFANTKLLLMPSLWNESFGLVAVEAMLNGIPVLASNRGALPETIGTRPHPGPLPDSTRPHPSPLPEGGLIKSCLISAIGLDLKEKNCCASFCEVIPDRTPRSEGCNSGVIMVEVWIAVQVPFIRHCQKLFSGACPLAREVQGST